LAAGRAGSSGHSDEKERPWPPNCRAACASCWRVFVNSAEGRAWPANLRRDPRVTLAVPNWEDPYEHVAIRGRAVEITSEGATEHIDSLAFKYRGEKTYSGKQRDERLKIRIEPDHVTHYGG
jgi:hypothetical protein